MTGHEAAETVIEVVGVSRRFGKKEALREVSLEVRRGQVFGLVGENGAGKTTLMQHLLGAYKAKTGQVRVFGIDPTYDPTAVLSRIGYLSEDRDLPLWMRVGEFMRYTQAFYPDWDETYAEQLRERFGLPLDMRIRKLSRGEKARAGLLAATHYQLDSLGIPGMGYGENGVPHDEAARAIIDEVRAYKGQGPSQVTLMDRSDDMYEAFITELGEG